jgi:hypothetical protein
MAEDHQSTEDRIDRIERVMQGIADGWPPWEAARREFPSKCIPPDVMERIGAEADGAPQTKVTLSALRHINAHRASYGHRPLDPRSSGWSDDDILTHARELGWEA